MPDTTVPPPSLELCGTDGVYHVVQGLDPVSEPTWLGALGAGEFGGGPFISDEIGERCGDAAAPDACNAEVDVTVAETWQRGLITTRGDLVETKLSSEEVSAFLGDINTAKEAALLVWHAGYEILCSGDFTSSVTRVEDGYRVTAYRSFGGCGEPWVTTRYTLGVYDATIVVEDEVVVAEDDGFGCVGRRPAGLTGDMSGVCTGAVAGDYFANIARLEESAVAAFDIMVDELAALGAPAELLEGAREAREDEVRHTEAMGALARRFGAAPLSPQLEAVAPRTPFEIALENAVEGCVRETFGALVGAHQALRAGDEAVAAAMREVADDEIRHAELSWAVAGWLEPQLTDDERARIAEAKRDAVVALRHQASEPVDPEIVALAGVPDAETAVQMVQRLAVDIWA
ncbi:MAG: ferritin-like domain-containing protein [Deltaproteobacteria bacterium]|nr:ferritin-like domain-containing protein [Deltaproteobacteria bacterium]